MCYYHKSNLIGLVWIHSDKEESLEHVEECSNSEHAFNSCLIDIFFPFFFSELAQTIGLGTEIKSVAQ